MIPRTFPSSVASNGSTQMIVYFLPSVSGLTRWVDYIPVKFTTVATAATENTYNQNGYIPVVSLSSIAGATPFKEYVPVFLDSSAADADVWDVTITGFIPVGTAGIGGAALYLDFAATTALDPRITFSRTTNATVTGSNGLIQYAPMNLLTFSEQFDNAAWQRAAGTEVVTANNSTAPNGTITADLLTTTASNGLFRPSIAIPSGATITFSVYAKRIDGSALFQLGIAANPSNGTTTFNLSTGVVVGNQASVVSSSITPVENGFYRCSVTVVATSTSATLTYYSAGGGFSCLLWGAQLELGSTATTYNPTTVKNLLGFTEHFDNAAWTKSNAFVQTNLLSWSEEFDNGVWTKNNVTVTSNATVSPSGSVDAEAVIPTTTSGVAHSIYQSITVSATAYSLSFYAKKFGYTGVRVANTTTGVGARFDLTNGAVFGTPSAGVTASISSAGNDWWRCEVSFTAAAGSTFYGVYAEQTPGTTVYAGDGTSGIYIWGAQLVQGTSAGDYKATYAAAAAVGYTDIYGQPFAQKLVENTANSTHAVVQIASVIAGTSYTITAYLKAAEETTATLAISASPFPRVKFDLAAGTIVSSQGGGAGTIVPVGNGWYRCSMTSAAPSTSGSILIALRDIDSNYTGDGTSGIYIFGAQLSDSASVDPYVYNPVAAPTSTAYYGPRFDYDPVTLAPRGLLIEEQRSNLATYSEDFTQASAWNAQQLVSVTPNATVSPDGTTTADFLIPNTNVAQHRVDRTTTITAAAHTWSVFAKAGGYGFAWLRIGNLGAYFDLSNGAIPFASAGVTASVVQYPNGWFRCIVSCTAVANDTVRINVLNSSGGSDFAGDGTSGIYVWGAQLEAGSFATSYIPTVASQVTRAADSASMIGNNFARWFNQTEGTFYLEQARVGPSATILYATDNTANNVSLQVFANASTEAKIAGIFAGAVQYDTNTGTIAQNTFYKLASAYKVNDVAASLNGAAVVTDTTVLIPAVTTLHIGSQPVNNTSVTRQQYFKRIAYYPRRLANTELTSITS